MLENDPKKTIEHIKIFNKTEGIKVGIAGVNGLPAFKTDITVPEEIFSGQTKTHIKSDSDIVFYIPLKNDKKCYRCHSPEDKTRGMIIIKTSMKQAQDEVNETAKRLLFFALFLGLTSEIFLIVIMRKIILKPINVLNEGAEILKAGGLDHRIEIKSDDEIGKLASCFNQMAESLENSHMNLEEIVMQKTKELRVITEQSIAVFKGNLTLEEIIEQFLQAIGELTVNGYSALCLADKEKGVFSQEFIKDINISTYSMGIALAGDHQFAKVFREARSVVKNAADIGISGVHTDVVIIPLLSHRRKRCWEINLCILEDCPAYNSTDERCWLTNNTLCRSPNAVAGKEKIYGCLHCAAFPVLGILIAGSSEEITRSLLHSLEIIASEIVSAIENQRLIDSKKEDISRLVRLHDISVETIQSLDMHLLIESIVSNIAIFTNMDAAIIWLKGGDEGLYRGSAYNIEKEIIPETLYIDESFIGRAIKEDKPYETIKVEDAACLGDVIEKNGFLYAAAVPLNFKGTICGCFTLFKTKDFFMNDSEKAIVSLFASQSAAAIQTAKLYRELTEEKEFSDAIFSDISSGIIVSDNEGLVLKINQAGAEILKINIHDVIGKKISDIYPDIKVMFLPELGPASEIDITLSDGKRIPVGYTNSPLYDSLRNKSGIIVLFRDLTEIKKLQSELRAKQHFEALGKVMAGVAHEIRNPLFGISSIVQILEREVQSEQHQALLHAMFKEIFRLKNIIEELLLYSRPSKLNIVETDLNIILEKIRRFINSKKDDIALNLMIQPSAIIRGDMDKLTQVFLNIMDNAVSSGCKKIDITAHKKDYKTLVITIKDDGTGIEKEILEKIFDPFFTTKKEGTGLGLPICKKIVEDHGGNIEIISNEGEGTIVLLNFRI